MVYSFNGVVGVSPYINSPQIYQNKSNNQAFRYRALLPKPNLRGMKVNVFVLALRFLTIRASFNSEIRLRRSQLERVCTNDSFEVNAVH